MTQWFLARIKAHSFPPPRRCYHFVITTNDHVLESLRVIPCTLTSWLQLDLPLRVLSFGYGKDLPFSYASVLCFVPSLHDSGGSGVGLWSSELMDLQVDYWLVPGLKKDVNKVLFILWVCFTCCCDVGPLLAMWFEGVCVCASLKSFSLFIVVSQNNVSNASRLQTPIPRISRWTICADSHGCDQRTQ